MTNAPGATDVNGGCESVVVWCHTYAANCAIKIEWQQFLRRLSCIPWRCAGDYNLG